jgi:hypothetical protein
MSDRLGQQKLYTDHYLVVAEVRERLAVNKQETQISYGEVQSEEVKRGGG